MKRLSTLLIILIIFFVGILLWWNHGTAPVNKNDTSQKIFSVEKGLGVREIANKLKKDGLIRDPVAFFILVKELRLDGKIQAGDFRLSPSLSAEEIAKKLTFGTLDIWVTIPEGKRAEEVASLLKDKIPQYSDSWITTLKSYEGYLFPDTYLFPRNADINLIVTIMRNNFDKKYNSIQPNPKNILTKEQIVILASLIEREAKDNEDRPLISSVLHNRLALGMPLQVDATVQYAIGFQSDQNSWWKKDLTLDDLAVASAFNTYKNVGLPPEPIANPGLAALTAAMYPSSTDYLYYITDKSGVTHYAKTLKEQNANIAKYGL